MTSAKICHQTLSENRQEQDVCARHRAPDEVFPPTVRADMCNTYPAMPVALLRRALPISRAGGRPKGGGSATVNLVD